MATPTGIGLLAEIDLFAKSIQKVSSWATTKKPFGQIINSTKENYVYEFWCYLKILEEINNQPNQNVILHRGSDQFPRSAASKKSNDWSYYNIFDSTNNLIYMVCAGTGVKRPDAPTIHHPDISFQKPTASKATDPIGTDVELLLDAKYVYPYKKNGQPKQPGKLTISIISEFSHIVEVLLRSSKTNSTSLNFGKFSSLNFNCLLSNAGCQKKHAGSCKIDCIKQVGDFMIGSTFSVIP